MAKVTETKQIIKYVLELDEEEAQALRNLFYSHIAGRGLSGDQPLSRISCALMFAGIDPCGYELDRNEEASRNLGYTVIRAKHND